MGIIRRNEEVLKNRGETKGDLIREKGTL